MTIRLAITPGEPAGIGPDLVLGLAREPRRSQWVVIADPDLLRARAELLGLRLDLVEFDPEDHSPDLPDRLRVLPVQAAVPATPGELDTRNAHYVVQTLEQGIDGCLAGEFSALVTGPVHKGVINDAGIPFSGHTELLQQRAGAEAVLMVLMADAMRVALVTTHVPLARVPALITRSRVERCLTLLQEGLATQFGITAPRILVAGLNPHAGEGGHLGREEVDVIGPVCQAFRDRGIDVRGPLPADTLFTPAWLEQADAVLAMYHDQGLPVLKHAGFGRAVNVTFGLPIIRTSVDHGTALDLAGTGRADAGSLTVAASLAETMVAQRESAGARQ